MKETTLKILKCIWEVIKDFAVWFIINKKDKKNE